MGYEPTPYDIPCGQGASRLSAGCRRKYDPRRFRMCGPCAQRVSGRRIPNEQKVLGLDRWLILDHLAGRPANFESARYYRPSFGGRACRNPVCGVGEIPGDTVSSAQIDHVIPVSEHGPDVLWNMQWLCRGCNKTKGASCTRRELELAHEIKEMYYRGPQEWWAELEVLDPRGARLLQEEMTGERWHPSTPSYRRRSHAYAYTGPYGGRATV